MFSLSLSYFQKEFILESTLNIQYFSFCNLIRIIYANEGENVSKYPPMTSCIVESYSISIEVDSGRISTERVRREVVIH